MRALFERIVSPCPRGQLLSLQEQLDELSRSVRSEIERIVLGRSYFSRADESSGGSPTLSLGQPNLLDYGVASPVSFDDGSGLREYASHMERAILEYEPRLRNPRVKAAVQRGGPPTVEVRGTLILEERQAPFYLLTACGETAHE